jgi:uncharacterized protein
MKNPVNWFEIYVQDMNRARQFYETVLDIQMEELQVQSETEDANTFQMVSFPFVENEPNTSGALVKTDGMQSGGNSILVYFTCEDCNVEQNRVKKSGGKVLKEKFSIGEYGFSSICLDTEGNTFGLHSMK